MESKNIDLIEAENRLKFIRGQDMEGGKECSMSSKTLSRGRRLWYAVA